MTWVDLFQYKLFINQAAGDGPSLSPDGGANAGDDIQDFDISMEKLKAEATEVNFERIWSDALSCQTISLAIKLFLFSYQIEW